MKILCVSDVVVDIVHSAAIAERFKDIDLVLSCGDLPYEYLEYIVTMLGKPLFYVHGNHAQHGMLMTDGTRTDEPGGCRNIHHRVVNYRGLLIAGLEGSNRYKHDGEHQYTPTQMKWLVNTMAPCLWWNQLKYGRAVDILITHAPPWRIHDGEDLCHQGFEAFLTFMDRYKPLYLIHGHTHLYRLDSQRVTQYKETTVLNTYGYQIIEIDEKKLNRARRA